MPIRTRGRPTRRTPITTPTANPPPRDQPTCPSCHYSLQSLPAGPCPECGRYFDPADPATYTPRRRFLSTFAPHPILNWSCGLFCLLTLILLGGPQGAGSDSGVILLGFFMTLIIVIWTLLFLIHLAARLAVFARRARQPRWRWSWFIIPIILFTTVPLLSSGLLWHARWRLSKFAFESALAHRQPGPLTYREGPHWRGLFHTDSIEFQADGSVWFELGFPDLYDRAKPIIIYSPQPLQPGRGPAFRTDLGGGWWVLTNPT